MLLHATRILSLNVAESLLALMKSKLLAQIDAQATTGAQSLAGAHVQASTSGQSTINSKVGCFCTVKLYFRCSNYE